MIDQNKEWVKFRRIFRGLKRTYTRAKKPNRLAEYEIPIDPKIKGIEKAQGAEVSFAPEDVLEREFKKDEEK
jgi:hypothetical protein